MTKVIMTIMEVAVICVPLFVAALFLLRSTDTYNEKYDVSKMRFIGFSRKSYRIFFRIIGFIALIIAVYASYRTYLYEPASDFQESKDFWDDINKSSDQNPITTAMALGAAIAIPARMASSRFPNKPLALLGGKAVIERVHEACKQSALAEKIVILTDSIEIMEFSDKIGAQSIMTSEKCQSGTERIIEAFDAIGADFIVNVQGDEPFISPLLIDQIIEVNRATNAPLVTAASKIDDAQSLVNPNVVKVLRDNEGSAMYFSRSPLPFVRGATTPQEWLTKNDYWRHIGIYGYSAKALARYDSLPISKMEKCEMLEQLRFIAAGFKFEIVETAYKSIGIDTPDDLKAAEEYLKSI